MQLTIHKTLALSGSATIPSSKSHNIRAMLLAMLAPGNTTLLNSLSCDDTMDAIKACELLGTHITREENALHIESKGLPLQTHTSAIYTGNSGITTHFIMPLLGLRQNNQQPIVLDCGAQMRTRPIHSLVNALKNLGLTIEYLNNPHELPVAISGSLQGGKTEVDGITSQYLSALLLALPCATNDSEIIVKDLCERSYVEMTLNYLQQQKIVYQHQQIKNFDIYTIPGKQKYQNFHATMPGDFSSASYFIAAAALMPSRVELHGLNMQDPQGDKKIVTILQQMGADIRINTAHLTICGGHPLTGLKIDASDIPDLLPTLAVIATTATDKTEIYNVSHARIKETDRIHSMADGLTRLGAKIDVNEDGMTIYPSKLQGAHVDSYGDHRTAMALSIAGLIAKGETTIRNYGAINKTFPNYTALMQSLGAKMEVSHELSA